MLEVVKVLVVLSNRGRMPNHYFSDTELLLKVRNIQNICCIDSSLLDW